MPPKKDKKKTKAKKAKKMRLSVMEPSPKFTTGFNRQIPGGVIGTGGGGGYVPSSFSVGGYASRQPPPASPIQTPDQFAIQRNLASQATAIESIVEEQKAVRRGRRPDKEKADEMGVSVDDYRAMRASERMPTEMPMTQTPIRQQVQKPSGSVSMDEVIDLTGGGASEVIPNITKVKIRRVKSEPGKMLTPPANPPPTIAVELFPGGGPERQQGLAMSVPGRIRTPAPDASQSLVGLQGIGEADVEFTPPTSGLQDQGTQGDEM